ncbi:hypothetical protein SESI111939_09110 [Serratia silvae]
MRRCSVLDGADHKKVNEQLIVIMHHPCQLYKIINNSMFIKDKLFYPRFITATNVVEFE